jgi:TolA-binding protein
MFRGKVDTIMAHSFKSTQKSNVTKSEMSRSRKKQRAIFLSLLALVTFPTSVEAQPPKGKGSGNTAAPQKTQGNSRLSEKEKRAERARELYADAANAQNNGAFELAVEMWSKLIKQFPEDALAPSAHHFLGICHLQKEKPEFELAINEFKVALQDPQLKQREESLVNLGWSLYQKSFQEGSDANPVALKEASKVLALVIDKYPDGSFQDKALFYAAEAESRMGHKEKAIGFYKQLAESKRFENSSVRPDALFGLGLTFEEMQQPQLAAENYESFLSKYPSHPIASSVRLRAAEVALQKEDAKLAITLLESLVQSKSFESLSDADYILYRYGFALAKAGNFNESASIYKRLGETFPKSQYAKNSSLAVGQSLMREKKYDEAVRAFEQLLPNKDERAAEAAHWICQVKTMQGKTMELISVARGALEWGSKSSSSILLQMDLADGLNGDASTRAEAKSIYEQLATQYPDDAIAPRATYNAAFSALQLGALADAQRWSEAFAKRFANDPLAADVAYVRAESTLQLGQHESAVNAFEQLIASQPNDSMLPTWELRLATAKYLLGQYDKTIALSEKLLRQPLEDNTRAEVLFLQGASQLKLKKNRDAIDSLQKSMEASSKWQQADEVSVMLAEAFSLEQNTKQAAATLEDLIKRAPRSRLRPDAEFRLGQIAAANGEHDKGIEYFDAVLANTKVKSIVDYATYSKAYLLIEKKVYDASLELLNKIELTGRADSFAIEVNLARAMCMRQLQLVDDAIRVLLPLRENVDGDQKGNVLFELGLCYSSKENYGSAIQAYEQIIDLFQNTKGTKLPSEEKVLFELAWAHQLSGNVAESVERFQALAAKYPTSEFAPEANFLVGQAEYDSSNFERAIKAYTVAATKSANSSLQEKSLYKLGWSYFQQKKYDDAIEQFEKQTSVFKDGSLFLDGKFMIAECFLKKESYGDAFQNYVAMRREMESSKDGDSKITEQVGALVYLHGGQSARELKKWKEAESWVSFVLSKYPQSSYRSIAMYELAYAKQNQKKTNEAIQLYSQIAEEFRDEIGARSRFMMGEVLFADREFAKAISEFQKVMYGYNGTQAPSDIKNWQARAAYEAGRCSEVLVGDLTAERRQKAAEVSIKFYEFVVQNHPDHELAKQAANRINDLKGKKS